MSPVTTERPLRVLHCPTAVGGHPVGLVRAERELGLDSVCVTVDDPPSDYEVDEVLGDRGRLRREAARWRLLARALRAVDVVHFNFGSSLLPRPYSAELTGRDSAADRLFRAYARLVELRDVGWLRRAGKGIVVTYQGADARHPEVARRLRADGGTPDSASRDVRELDAARRRGIATFERHADRIYALNPDLLHVLPGRAEFLPYAHLDPREWRPPATSRSPSLPPVVAHAPSARAAKGTQFILDAVARLQAEGVPLEFELVEGVLRNDARRVYERADIVVDQLLVGWYGALAVDAMALGKVAVAHIREDDLGFLPEEMRAALPVVQATPATVYDQLRALVTAPREQLAELGRRGRSYVERWHDPLAVARRLKTEYQQISGREPGDPA